MQKKLLKGFLAFVFSLFTQAAVAQELLVSAAVSLSNAFREIGQIFEQQYPGSKVIFNFAGSGVLLRQIEQGAPVDVFVSADEMTMDKAQELNLLVDGSRDVFAENKLVLIVPKSKNRPQKLGDLQQQTYMYIALGTPSSVPAGNYAKTVLEHEGLWKDLESKFVYGESVRQVLQYVGRNEVDAGFVYKTDAILEANHVDVALDVQSMTSMTYPIAQIKNSEHPELAKAFIHFLKTPQAQEILSQYGFTLPSK